MRYTTDTTGGNSGSPVILDGTNLAIGIHTHGGCSSTGGSNIGTSSTRAELQAALANPLGVCQCPGLYFTYPNGRPDFVANDGSGKLRVQIAGNPAVVPGSVRLHLDTGNGFVPVVPLALQGGVFEASVPATLCNQALRYHWTATDANNTAFADPATAPQASHFATAAVGGTLLRSHDFSTTPAGWGVVNLGVSAGGWARGVLNDPNGPGADADGSGQCWVTGNSPGMDLDGGPSQLRSELLDLSAAVDPYVRAALWFTCDTGEDRLSVEISSDFGGTWQPMASLAPFAGWQVHTFRVRDHVATPGLVLVRFVASDNPNNSNTEAGVDAFAVFDATCPTGTWTTFGTGCAPSGAIPALAALSMPTLGTTFALQTQNLAGGAPFLVIGSAVQLQYLSQYGFGANCINWIAPITAVFTPGGGYSLAIPPAPGLSGLRLYYQAIELGRSAVSNAGLATIR